MIALGCGSFCINFSFGLFHPRCNISSFARTSFRRQG
jgi:hypothetical protein